MKITLEIPDNSSCMVVTVVHGDSPWNLAMLTHSSTTDEIRSGKTIEVKEKGENENEN